MSDASSFVPWVTAALGCACSYGVARFTRRKASFFSVLLAGGKAFGLSIASIFVASLLHNICVNTLHRCTSHGDGNIAYILGGVFAFPLFWIIIALFGGEADVEPVLSTSSQCDAASSAALIEHLEGKADLTLCPACGQAISAKRDASGSAGVHVVTRCRCGKCDARFQVPRAGA